MNGIVIRKDSHEPSEDRDAFFSEPACDAARVDVGLLDAPRQNRREIWCFGCPLYEVHYQMDGVETVITKPGVFVSYRQDGYFKLGKATEREQY